MGRSVLLLALLIAGVAGHGVQVVEKFPSSIRYNHVGCFKDEKTRAIPQADGKYPSLTDCYHCREDAINKCAAVAAENNYKVFAVQNGGWCATGPNAQDTYNKYGPSTACNDGGKGGPWSNDVYWIGDSFQTKTICEWKSAEISCPEGFQISIKDAAYGRTDRTTCADGPIKTTTCSSRFSLQRTRDRCDNKASCILEAKNSVYTDPCVGTFKYLRVRYTCQKAVIEQKYDFIGCYKDKPERAIPPLEGKDQLLMDEYKKRQDAIDKCARVAAAKNYGAFGVQNGGQCFAGPSAQYTYDKYGKSDACNSNGKGGVWSNAVYSFGELGHSETVCEWKSVKISCPDGFQISIQDAVYGRSDRSTCSTGPIKTTTCSSKFSLQRTRDRCDNKVSCILEATNSVYTDPCVGTFKYLRVRYTCQKAVIVQKYTFIGCYKDKPERAIPPLEGKDQLLTDKYKQRQDAIDKCAKVAAAKNYGAFAVQNGGQCFAGPSAQYTYDKYGKSDACNSNGKGGVWSNAVYSFGELGHLETVCEWKSVKISCPDGFQIFIQDAVYGRSDRSTCSTGPIKTTTCSSRFSLQRTRDRCDNKASCMLEAKNSVYTDPCVGTFKYLRVRYTCQKAVTVQGYKFVGCYKDKARRAIPLLERKDKLLKGFYKKRQDAIDKCARVAIARNYKVFAVQNGGQCLGGHAAQYTYNTYGKSDACREDGEGGVWSNAVYSFEDLGRTPKFIGCFKDTRNRAIPSAEGSDSRLDGNYKKRADAIRKCAEVAASRGFKVFAVQNGGWCATGPDAPFTYHKYGRSPRCKNNGKGGWMASAVYSIGEWVEVPNYKPIGCFKDTGNRAITQADGRFPMLKDNYHRRAHAIQKCASLASSLGYSVFAIQNGGWCATGPTARQTYSKYGSSNACDANGKGGPWANAVYMIIQSTTTITTMKWSYVSVGCFRDTSNRAIPTAEGKYPVLDGNYQARTDARKKCAQVAASKNYKVFAVQHGGWCATSATADLTYDKYGGSNACKADGEGGPWANAVYEIVNHVTTVTLCERTSRKIACPTGYAISIEDAMYGRLNRATCGNGPIRSTQCHSATSLLRTLELCDNKQTCTLQASNDFYSDPCVGTKKYLSVKYRCQKSVENTQTTSQTSSQQIETTTKQQWRYVFVGCYKDTSNRAIPTAEGKYPVLDGNYQARKDAKKKCAQVAASKHYKVFAVQHGGWCATSATADITYDKYGGSNACKPDGEGGPWANAVYEIVDQDTTVTLCERTSRKIACPTGYAISIEDAIYGRLNREICGDGPIHSTQCRSATSLQRTRELCDNKGTCTLQATNGIYSDPCVGTKKYLSVKYICQKSENTQTSSQTSSQQIETTTKHQWRYVFVGCFKDTSNRAIPTAEGKYPVLDGNYQARKDAMKKCAQVAASKHYKVFAVQHGGWCATSATADLTYDKYGGSNACKPDGEGGPWANAVYEIVDQDTTVTLCERTSRKIACPTGYAISIEDAMYGRLNREICGDGPIHSTQCRSATSLQRTRELCDNKGTCTLQATNGIYSDPCVGTAKYLSVKYICKKAEWRFVFVGCFKDTGNRAIPTAEGKYPVLDGNYQARKDARMKCAEVAASNHYKVFAVQHGGWCATSATADITYDKYGGSNACKPDGEGGPWANAVYEIVNKDMTVTLCERTSRKIACPTGYAISIEDAMYGRLNREICGDGPIHSTQCRSATSLQRTRELCDNKGTCTLQATNGIYSDPCVGTAKYLSVKYICKKAEWRFVFVGCFKDTGNRAIPTAEGKYPSLDGNYQARKDARMKCAEVAASKNYKVFAVQNGGWCATSATADLTYNKYGGSNACKPDGEGGPWANAVYKIVDQENIQTSSQTSSHEIQIISTQHEYKLVDA